MAGKKNVKNVKNTKNKVKNDKVEEPKVEEPKVEEPKVEEPKVEEPKVEEPDNVTFEILFNNINEVIQKISTVDEISIKDINKIKKEYVSQLKNLLYQTKKLEKKIEKNKNVEKKKRKVTNSGFDKTIDITDEAKQFITEHCKKSLDENTNLTRKVVNKYIHDYIKDNNLQNPKMKREILPDKALKTILTPLLKEKNKNGTTDAENGYNYFNLQRYIKHIFIKV